MNEIHGFYCMNCGKAFPLPRKKGKQKERFHRKRLYCPFCNAEVNHIECKTDEDVTEFKERFNLGEYKEEAISSIEFIKQEREMFNYGK